jgi:hypothetical protein
VVKIENDFLFQILTLLTWQKILSHRFSEHVLRKSRKCFNKIICLFFKTLGSFTQVLRNSKTLWINNLCLDFHSKYTMQNVILWHVHCKFQRSNFFKLRRFMIKQTTVWSFLYCLTRELFLISQIKTCLQICVINPNPLRRKRLT